VAAVEVVVAAAMAAVVDLCSSMSLWARDGLACDAVSRNETEGTERRLLGCPESADFDRERVIIHSNRRLV
jgi:hypothetical protein